MCNFSQWLEGLSSTLVYLRIYLGLGVSHGVLWSALLCLRRNHVSFNIVGVKYMTSNEHNL